MIKVSAVVPEHQLDAVAERLVLVGVRTFTVSAVKGSGRSNSRRAVFRGNVYLAHFVNRVLLEWVGPEEDADAVVRAIQQRGKNGKIFVQRVDEAVRIRTGERGPGAA